jgi:hypothetical protein
MHTHAYTLVIPPVFRGAGITRRPKRPMWVDLLLTKSVVLAVAGARFAVRVVCLVCAVLCCAVLCEN